MAPGDLARRVGQRRLEEKPSGEEPSGEEPGPEPEPPLAPADAAVPGEPTVPPEGSAAELDRRRRRWLEERQRYDDSAPADPPAVPAPDQDDPAPSNG